MAVRSGDANVASIAAKRAATELGHELVAIAAVDRADVLDDLSIPGARDALEEERR